jgi:hypothetical protein
MAPTIIRTRRRSYTEPQFRRLVRGGFSHPLPDGISAASEIERIIRAEDVQATSVSVARRIALDEHDQMTRGNARRNGQSSGDCVTSELS